MERTITLPLKKKWFDLIKSGEKKEEYREITPYWISRFVKVPKWKVEHILETPEILLHDMSVVSNYEYLERGLINLESKCKNTKLEFTLGYPRKDDSSRRMVFKNPSIRIGCGKPEWGAEPGKQYFVITWEE